MCQGGNIADPWIVVAYVLIVAVFATLPILADMYLAYRSQKDVADKLLKEFQIQLAKTPPPAELRELIKAVTTPPPGIPGLGRQTMALTVLVILGIALFHTLVIGIPSGSETVVGNVLSVLAGALSAIIGFYYGGKAAEKKVEPGK